MKRQGLFVWVLLGLLPGSRVWAQEPEHLTFIVEEKIEPETPEGDSAPTEETSATPAEPEKPRRLDPDYAGLRLAVDEMMQTDKNLFLPSSDPLHRRLSTLVSNPYVQQSLLLCKNWVSTFVPRPPAPSSYSSDHHPYLLSIEEDEYLDPLLVSMEAQVYEALAQGETDNALTSAELLLNTLVTITREHFYDCNPGVNFENLLSLFALHLPEFSIGQLPRLAHLVDFVEEITRNLKRELEEEFLSELDSLQTAKPDLDTLRDRYRVDFEEKVLPSKPGFTCTLYTSVQTREEIQSLIDRGPALLAEVVTEARQEIEDPLKYEREHWGKPETPEPTESNPPDDEVHPTPDQKFKGGYEHTFRGIYRSCYQILVFGKLDAHLFLVHLEIEKFRREHDRLPTSIFELGPREWANDLISGKPLTYKLLKNEDACTLTCNGTESRHDKQTHQFVPGDSIDLIALDPTEYIVRAFLPPEPERAPDATPDPDPIMEETP